MSISEASVERGFAYGKQFLSPQANGTSDAKLGDLLFMLYSAWNFERSAFSRYPMLPVELLDLFLEWMLGVKAKVGVRESLVLKKGQRISVMYRDAKTLKDTMHIQSRKREDAGTEIQPVVTYNVTWIKAD